MARTRGEKGQGGIFRYPGSKFWWVRYPHNGSEARESSKSTRRTDAVALLTQRLGEVQNGTIVPKTGKVTVAELLDDLRETYTMQGRASLRTIRGHLAAVTAQLGRTKAQAVTLPVLTKAVRHWQGAGYAPATIKKFLATLHRAFVLGHQARKVAVVPPFPSIPVHNARQGFAEWPTVQALLDALPDDGLRDFVEWCARTGMRKGEAAKLTWAGYDRETQVVRLPGKDAKTGAPRRIVLAGPLLALVARRLAVRKRHPDAPFLFVRVVPGVTPDAPPAWQPVREFRKSWATACKAAGVEALRFHDLRRTAVRNMIRAGVSQTVAMAISGHKTDAVFRRYDITSDDDLRQAMERTAAYVETLPRTVATLDR
jgi:integrase